MLHWAEKMFEGGLWRSRWVVMVAVVASLGASLAMFYVTTVDVTILVSHAIHYADSSLTTIDRQTMRTEIVAHLVEVVDGYLLAMIMLIFSLGLYELFISDIDEAHGSQASSKILVIESLDDLKARLAKVILMILIVYLFQSALKMKTESPLELLYVGGAIALVGVAVYLSHGGSHNEETHEGTPSPEPQNHDHA